MIIQCNDKGNEIVKKLIDMICPYQLIVNYPKSSPTGRPRV